jgi:hypothetical protein
MLRVAPVLSRVIPIMAPKIIRNPIEAIVLPKPSFIEETTFSAGRVEKARKTDTMNRAMNACSLSFEVSRIIARMLIATMMEL